MSTIGSHLGKEGQSLLDMNHRLGMFRVLGFYVRPVHLDGPWILRVLLEIRESEVSASLLLLALISNPLQFVMKFSIIDTGCV